MQYHAQERVALLSKRISRFFLIREPRAAEPRDSCCNIFRPRRQCGRPKDQRKRDEAENASEHWRYFYRAAMRPIKPTSRREFGSLSAPRGGEGRGEVGDSRELAERPTSPSHR